MQIFSYSIISALKPYIKEISTMECDYGSDTNIIRVLPDACVELFLNYTVSPAAIINNELYRHSIATFRMNKSMDVQMRKGAGIIAVCFNPGMAYRFIQEPMHRLSDTITSLTDLCNNKFAEIENKLAELPNNEIRVNLIQKHLLQILVKSKDDIHISACLKQVQLSDNLTTVKNLINDKNISQRHLSRKFQELVGQSPKEYLRVSRFIYSLKQLKSFPVQSLTIVALKSGYYDQAHCIREYKHYTGCTPGQVLHATHIF